MGSINPLEARFPNERRRLKYGDPNAPWQTWPLTLLAVGIIVALSAIWLI
jgi:hypothetical protein